MVGTGQRTSLGTGVLCELANFKFCGPRTLESLVAGDGASTWPGRLLSRTVVGERDSFVVSAWTRPLFPVAMAAWREILLSRF